MNISTNRNIRKVILYLSFLLSPLFLKAQVLEQATILKNTTYVFDFEAVFVDPVIVSPSNGTLQLAPPVNISNTYTYTPTFGYTGTDNFTIKYYSPTQFGTEIIEQSFDITIVESIVDAQDDFISTNVNTPITVNVLENDNNIGGNNLTISDITLINHGEVNVGSGGELTFTPYNGFVGVAHFNYVACDDLGTCGGARVTVFVSNPYSTSDSTFVSTPKNTAVEVLVDLSNGYQVLDNPNHGTINVIGLGEVLYTPDEGFTGTDIISFAINMNANTSVFTAVIEVLPLAINPNAFAMDDYIYVAQDQDGGVSFNVLENDLANNIFFYGFTNTGDLGGTLTPTGNGNFTFTPDGSSEGVSTFTYRAATWSWEIEEATVYIITSNQPPAPQTFDLTTPKNTPLIINYDIPILNYSFNTDFTSPAYGTVTFHEGNYSTVIGGQTVEGYNMLIYRPNPDEIGMDVFEVSYCVDGGCSQTVKINVDIIDVGDAPTTGGFCIDDCIWAGDANYDGQVNMRDLLPIGMCVGETGYARPDASLENWYGQFGDDWNGTIFNATDVDLKHVDTDGNGTIGAIDTFALNKFYGRLHSLVPAQTNYLSNTPLSFRYNYPNPLFPGDLVEIDIVLGTNAVPAYDMHGLTFQLSVPSSIVKEGTLEVSFDQNNWLAYNSATIQMAKEPIAGKLDVGYTRAGIASASGFGNIGKVRFIIRDDLIIRRDSDIAQIEIEARGGTMKADGYYYDLTVPELTIPGLSKPKL